MKKSTKRTSRNRSVAATLLAMLLNTAAVMAEDAEATSRPEILLVDCAGSYVRLDASGERIVTAGKIWDAPTLGELRPAVTSKFDGCLVEDLESAPDRGVAYMVLAKEPFSDRQGRKRFRLAAVTLAELRLVGDFEIPEKLAGAPALLLAPDGETLLVTYDRVRQGGGEPWDTVIDHYSVPDFRRMTSKSVPRQPEVLDREPLYASISRRAYRDARGNIIEGNAILDGEGRFLHRINPYEAIPAAVKEQLRPLERTGVSGRKFLALALADSAGGRMLFAVNHDLGNVARGGSGLWLYDVGSGLSFPPIRTARNVAAYNPGSRSTPTAHLTPSSDRVIVEGYEWREVRAVPGSGSDTLRVRFKTGEIEVYDAASAQLERTLSLDPAPGFYARVLGFSPDDRFLYYGSREFLYVVDLKGDSAPKALPSPGRFDSFWTMGFAFFRR